MRRYTQLSNKQGLSKIYFSNHVKVHGNASEIISAAEKGQISKAISSLGTGIRIDQKALNTYRWIDWVVMGNLPFQFVACARTRKYAKLTPISVNTLKKYMIMLVEAVEKKVKHSLPDYFGIIIDGWTEGNTHFVAIFASFADINGGLKQPLLACSPMGDETSQSADVVVNFIQETLALYGKKLDCLAFLSSDNTALNPAIAKKLEVPFVGCMSHRLALAVEKYVQNSHTAELLNNLNRLMIKLSSSKMTALLRKNGCDLAPVQRNATRWSSTYSMLQRYLTPSFLSAVDRMKDRGNFVSRESYNSFCALVPEGSIEEQEESPKKSLHMLCEEFKKVHEATLLLQKADLDVLMAEEIIQMLIKELDNEAWAGYINHYCSDSYASRCSAESLAFIKGVRRLLLDPLSATDLSEDEKFALRKFRVDIDASAAVDDVISPVKPGASMSEKLEKREKRRKMENENRLKLRTEDYRGMNSVAPTSNVCERLFSLAGLVWSSLRKAMLPRTLEMILYLRVNRHLWDEREVSEVIAANNID